MLNQPLPYCGLPPAPGELLSRFNLDPALLVALGLVAFFHIAFTSGSRRQWAALGWLVASAAFVSPLCALSISLFSARVGQHMILILVAAPLIGLAWPFRRPRGGSAGLWTSTAAFFLALWFWHMPEPYDATFRSTPIYWAMHLTLFGSAIFLWRELLHHHIERTAAVLTAGALTSMQMGLLGAVLTFASHPIFLAHLTTAASWGLSPIRDQQLGGVFMWVPGILLFLLAAMRSAGRLWHSLEGAKPA
jgi:putative membrane protein